MNNAKKLRYVSLTGWVIFCLSLFLPAITFPTFQGRKVAYGFFCAIMGYWFYPSNILIFMSPILFPFIKKRKTLMVIYCFLMLASFASAVMVYFEVFTGESVKPVYIGYYLWVASFLIEGISFYFLASLKNADT